MNRLTGDTIKSSLKVHKHRRDSITAVFAEDESGCVDNLAQPNQ
jgi:hypothetical protein